MILADLSRAFDTICFRNLIGKMSKLGALYIYEKNPEISVVAKVEFPIGKKLFHFKPGKVNKFEYCNDL